MAEYGTFITIKELNAIKQREREQGFHEGYQQAMSEMKAQEPVKPYVSGDGKDFENASTWWYACGNCNKPIDPNDKYCRYCGRKVKWDDDRQGD